MSERVVADTNVLISAIFWDGNESKIIELSEEGELDLLTSISILNELKSTLSYDKFELERKTIEERVEYYLVLAEIVSIENSVDEIQEDPEDNKILSCAKEGDADYIASGDEHLLKLEEFEGIRIMTAGELLEILPT